MINTINNKQFETANEAYEYLHDAIIQHGTEFGDTKALFNVGVYITNPLANAITNKERKWNIVDYRMNMIEVAEKIRLPYQDILEMKQKLKDLLEETK